MSSWLTWGFKLILNKIQLSLTQGEVQNQQKCITTCLYPKLSEEVEKVRRSRELGQYIHMSPSFYMSLFRVHKCVYIFSFDISASFTWLYFFCLFHLLILNNLDEETNIEKQDYSSQLGTLNYNPVYKLCCSWEEGMFSTKYLVLTSFSVKRL